MGQGPCGTHHGNCIGKRSEEEEGGGIDDDDDDDDDDDGVRVAVHASVLPP